MILCDTNVFIHAFNGDGKTIAHLKTIGLEKIALSTITVMELYQGMGNKTELSQMKKKIRYYDIAMKIRHMRLCARHPYLAYPGNVRHKSVARPTELNATLWLSMKS